MSLPNRLRDGRLLVPVALLIVTTVYLVTAIQMAPPMRNGNITASFFPLLIAIVMDLALLSVLWQTIRSTPEQAHDDKAPPTDDANNQRYGPLWVTLLTALYIVAFSTLGYFTSTACYVFALTLLFGEGLKRWPTKLLATGLITLSGYLLFELIFRVRLPTFWSL